MFDLGEIVDEKKKIIVQKSISIAHRFINETHTKMDISHIIIYKHVFIYL